MRLEDPGSQWKSEREGKKEETSRKSETVRLAIINHIRSWRPPGILATRQTLRLPSAPFPSCSSSLVTLISHPAPGHALKSGPSQAGPAWLSVPSTFQQDALGLHKASAVQRECAACKQKKRDHFSIHAGFRECTSFCHFSIANSLHTKAA